MRKSVRGKRRFMSLLLSLAMIVSLLAEIMGSSAVMALAEEGGEPAAAAAYPAYVTADGDASDWDIFTGNVLENNGGFKFVKAFTAGGKLNILARVSGEPAGALAWYVGINTDNDAQTGYLDYDGADYAILEGSLYAHPTNDDAWAWNEIEADGFEMAASSDNKNVEISVSLSAIGNPDSVSFTILDGSWSHVARSVRVMTYGQAVGSIAAWDREIFSNNGTDGAYLSDMVQEKTADGIKVMFPQKKYTKTRFWGHFTQAADLSKASKLIIKYQATNEIMADSLTFRLFNGTESLNVTLSASSMDDEYIIANVPEGTEGMCDYIRFYEGSLPGEGITEDTVITITDIDFVGIAESSEEGGEGGEEGGEGGNESFIKVDGAADEWLDVRDLLEETRGRFDRVAAFYDEENVYILYCVNDGESWSNAHVYFDVDGDASTGYPALSSGCEAMIEGSNIYTTSTRDWFGEHCFAINQARSADKSVTEIMLPIKNLGDGVTDIDLSNAYMNITLIASDWSDVEGWPAGSMVKLMSMEEAIIVSDEPAISNFAFTPSEDTRALTESTMQNGVIGTFSAEGGNGTDYSYSLLYSAQKGVDNSKFEISGNRLIVKEKLLAPGEYRIFVKVRSGVRFASAAFAITVDRSAVTSVTEDLFGGNNGEWFTVPYSTANLVPNFTELKAVADSEYLYVYAQAAALPDSLRLYITDNKSAGADMSAIWTDGGNMAYCVDYDGNILRYDNGAFTATGIKADMAATIGGFECRIALSVFDAEATCFGAAVDDGAGALLPNAGNKLLSVEKPLPGNGPAITADGDPSEWTDEYKIGIGTGSLSDLWGVRTADMLYAMTFVTVDESEKDALYATSTNLFIDSDNNTSTGNCFNTVYTEAGADFLLQDWNEFEYDPQFTYATGNSTGFGFSHSSGGCGDKLTTWKVVEETSTPGVFCIEFAVPIANMESVKQISIDDMSISVQRDAATVRTNFSGVTKADRADGVYMCPVPKYGTHFDLSVDGNYTDWQKITNVAVNTATESVYNMFATRSQYVLYTMIQAANNGLNTLDRWYLDTDASAGFAYDGFEGADFVVKEGKLYKVTGNGSCEFIDYVNVDYYDGYITMQVYLKDIGNPAEIKLAASVLNDGVKIPANGYMAVAASFDMSYPEGYVYPYKDFSTYNNPYKGWAGWADGDPNKDTSQFEEIAYDYNLVFFPVTWADLQENGEDTADWTNVNSKYHLSYWKEKGVRVNFRFVMDTPVPLTGTLKDTTYGMLVDRAFIEDNGLIDNGAVTVEKVKELIATGNYRMDIPTWTFAELCNDVLAGIIDNAGTFYNWPDSDVLGGAGFSPNYYSEKFINRHANMISLFANRFDDTQVTGFVQIGSLGHWGEFHTWPTEDSFAQYGFGSGEFPDPSTAARYVQAYIDSFKEIKLGLRYPYPVAAQNDFGLFNDVFGAEEGTESFLNAIRNGNSVNITNPGPTDIADSRMPDFWKINYSGGEFSNGDVLRWIDDDSIMQTITYMRDSHTSWLGPCSPCDLLVSQPSASWYEGNIEYLQRIMGYRFTVNKASYNASVNAGETLTESVTFENLGVAPFYYNWPVEISLLDKDGNAVVKKVCTDDIRTWLPGSEYTVTQTLTVPSNLASGRYTVAVSILDKDTLEPAVHLAIKGQTKTLRYALYELTVIGKSTENNNTGNNESYSAPIVVLPADPADSTENTGAKENETVDIEEQNTPADSSEKETEEDEEPAVSKNYKKLLSKVKISKKTASVKKGKTKKLYVSLPEEILQVATKKYLFEDDEYVAATVKWTSSNKKVAKVSKNGKVTGLKKGKAVIKATITLANGSEKTVKCTVTVK